jgi:hypothetical protein
MSISSKEKSKWAYFLPLTIACLFVVDWFWKWSINSTLKLATTAISYADGLDLNETEQLANRLNNNNYFNFIIQLIGGAIIVVVYFVLGDYLGPNSTLKNRILYYVALINYIVAVPIGLYAQNVSLATISLILLFLIFLFKEGFSGFISKMQKLNSSIILILQVFAGIIIVVTSWYYMYYIYLFAKIHGFLATLLFAPYVCALKAIVWPLLL